MTLSVAASSRHTACAPGRRMVSPAGVVSRGAPAFGCRLGALTQAARRQTVVMAAVGGLSRAFMHNLCTFKVEGAEALHAALDRPPGQVARPCLSGACVLRLAFPVLPNLHHARHARAFHHLRVRR